MVTIENAFKWIVVAVLVTAIVIAGLFNYSRGPVDPMQECIIDRLVRADELTEQGHDERDFQHPKISFSGAS